LEFPLTTVGLLKENTINLKLFKMKATLFFLLSLLSFGLVYSQEINCVEKQKELSLLVSENRYQEATDLLTLLRKKCSSQNEDIYKTGVVILQRNVEAASEPNKASTVSDLVKLLDQYDANFPDNKNGNLIIKAMLLYDTKKATDAEVFTILNKAFTKSREQFTHPNALYIYFKMYNENYKNKKDGISLEQLLEKFNDVLLQIEKTKVAYPQKATECINASRACKFLVKEFLVPENLIAMVEKNYEANNQNVAWLDNSANLLSAKSAASAIFGKVATQLHQLEPTAASAFHLANFNLKNKNQKAAHQYFKESATLNTNPTEKAAIYFNLATMLSSSDKEEARKLIQLAAENNPKNGAYFILLANMYVNSLTECTTTELEKKAIYQLATQSAQKAAQTESRLKKTAEQLITGYNASNLTNSELDQIKKLGGKVKIGCWINESVQFN
jgi:hypothetical protein